MPSASNDLERIKFEQTNQQIIKQNIQIHAQLRSMQKKFQDCQEENTELKVRIGILEDLNRRLNNELATLKKEIIERSPTLDLISSHLGDLSKLFIQLCQCDQQGLEGLATNFSATEDTIMQPVQGVKRTEVWKKSNKKSKPRASALSPIKENEESIENILEMVDAIEFS